MRWVVSSRIGMLAAALAGAAAFSDAAAQAVFATFDNVYSAPVTSMRDLPFRTVVRQQFDYSCGSAALATMLSQHYGRRVTEAGVFRAMYAVGDQAQIQRVGFSLLDMKTYLQSIGLASDGFRFSLQDLAASSAPAIAVVQLGAYRHFVVIKGVRAGRVLVGDPALGLKAYPLADFARIWNGVVFLIDPGASVGAYNRADEWASLPHGVADPLPEPSLARFTRGLPPIYQLRTIGP